MYGDAARQMSKDPAWSDPHLERDVAPREEPAELKLVCYYNLQSSSTFHILTPDSLEPYLCTHINIAFATVTNGTLQPSCPSELEVPL